MLADWSVECGQEDAVLVVPWTTEETTTEVSTDEASPATASFIDLRDNPYDLDQIPEAEQHPALLHALRALNAPRSAVYTAKCDAWTMDPNELATVQAELAYDDSEAPFGFASYIDLVWRDRSLFVSFAQQEQRLQRLARLLERVELPYTMIESVLRPALVETGGRYQEGFAISLYVKALGTDAAHAYSGWAEALAAVVTTLRGKEFSAG